MTFYWNLWTPGTYKLTMSEIDTVWENASSSTWSAWRSAAYDLSTNKGANFVTKGTSAGVIH